MADYSEAYRGRAFQEPLHDHSIKAKTVYNVTITVEADDIPGALAKAFAGEGKIVIDKVHKAPEKLNIRGSVI